MDSWPRPGGEDHRTVPGADVPVEGRGQQADERDRQADVRDLIADIREMLADVRDGQADGRAAHADARDTVANTLQRGADRREELADRRDQLADKRDALADKRDALADERDRRSAIAVEQERRRIAADLHDLVIQSLYSAAIDLNRLTADLDPPRAAEANAVIDRIDEAIARLRASIHGMTNSVGARQFLAELTQVVEESVVILGFAPRLVIDGRADLIPADAHNDLLAVAREALSNVAKHARATRAEVTLTVGRDEIWLRIADDGVGPGESARSSGVANIRARAQRLRGDATVVAAGATGTIVDWRIPL